jgi:hypothetical protein
VVQSTNKSISDEYCLCSPDFRVPTKATRIEKPTKSREKVIDWKKVVAFTWDHLHKNYYVGEGDISSTTISTWSRHHRYTQAGENLYISKIKRLCIAIIHFEDVFHQIMECTDPPPQGNWREPYFRRNWRENPNLGELPLTQAQSIYLTAAIDDKSENLERLLESIQPLPYTYNNLYCWDLRHLLREYDPEISYNEDFMFGISRACTSAAYAIKWIETVTLFVRASFSSPAGRLRNGNYPPTLQGLARFLQGNHRPDGMSCGEGPSGDTSSSSGSE